jgi:hypothetical protein
MDRSSGRDRVVGHRRAVRARGGPLRDQGAQALEILGLRGEDHIDIASGTNHSVADQRDPTDEHIADAHAVEIIEDRPEAAHRSV